MLSRTGMKRSYLKITTRFFSEKSVQGPGKTSSSPPGSKVNVNVPGLSTAVIHQANEPLGPGVDPKKTGPYKVPEYFCYDNMSFFEAEIEMSKFRLPQPSALKQ